MRRWRRLVDGVVQAVGPRFISSEPLWSGFNFRVGIKVGDSPSDSLDTSIILSSFSTFTMVEVPMGGRLPGISGRGLLIVLSGMKGLFTVEPADWRLPIYADRGGIYNGRPYAL